jgi:hypothetical protein
MEYRQSRGGVAYLDWENQQMGKRLLIISLLLLAPLAFGAPKPSRSKPATSHRSTHRNSPAGKRAASSHKGNAHAKHVGKGKKQGLKKLAFWHK